MLVICKRKITLKNEHTVLCKIQVSLNHDLFLNLFKEVHRDYDKSIPCFHNHTCWPCLLRHHQFWKESWYHQSYRFIFATWCSFGQSKVLKSSFVSVFHFSESRWRFCCRFSCGLVKRLVS